MVPEMLKKREKKSLTAKSTRCNFPTLTCCSPSGPFSLHSIVTVNIAWDRELCRFIFVAPVTPETCNMYYRKMCHKSKTVSLSLYTQPHQVEVLTTWSLFIR